MSLRAAGGILGAMRRWPVLILLLLVAACGADSGGLTPTLVSSNRPPVILIIIDTLRADHLGLYGHALPTSPVLDQLAGRSTVFEAHTSQCNATFPSITSIFTGLYPRTHKNYLAVSVDGQVAPDAGVPSLAERLSQHGYETLAVVSHPWWREAPVETAIGRGWDAFLPIPPEVTGQARRREGGTAEATTERALGLLARRDATRPPFLWVHYFDPHTPYDPPLHQRDRFLAAHLQALGLGAYESELAALPADDRLPWIRVNSQGAEQEALRLASGRALYDAEIADCDEQLGRLLSALDAEDLLDPALVIVLADHGENMDAGREHLAFTHARMFEGVMRVPLLIKLPGQRSSARVSALSQSIDVLPTVLELLQLPSDPQVEGRSLVPLLNDPGGELHPLVFAESSDNLERLVRDSEWKFIDPGTGEPNSLYRWKLDPQETRNVVDEAPEQERVRLASLLSAFRPHHALQLVLHPDSTPYQVSIELRLEGARLLSVDEPLRLLDASVAFGTVAVSDQPVTLSFPLDQPLMAARLLLRRLDGARLDERIFVGSSPVADTPAQLSGPDDSGALELLLPKSGSLGVHLLGAAPQAVGKGALVLRLAESNAPALIDESVLDAEQLEELRALGYLR